MQEVAIGVNESLPPGTVEAVVECSLTRLGMSITMRDTLRSFPGCIHWHAKKARHRGVLEVTYWPRKNRLWLSVHHNRDAPWIHEVIQALRHDLEVSLAPT